MSQMEMLAGLTNLFIHRQMGFLKSCKVKLQLQEKCLIEKWVLFTPPTMNQFNAQIARQLSSKRSNCYRRMRLLRANQKGPPTLKTNRPKKKELHLLNMKLFWSRRIEFCMNVCLRQTTLFTSSASQSTFHVTSSFRKNCLNSQMPPYKCSAKNRRKELGTPLTKKTPFLNRVRLIVRELTKFLAEKVPDNSQISE